MSTLIIRKKSLKTWLHTDSILGDFIISKFYFNADNGNFQVVEQGQSRRVIYDVTDITLYDDTDGGVAETFANITALSLRLEELNYPAFQYDGQIVSIANLIEAGTNVTITGDGTEASPYVINSSGGSGGGAVTSVNSDTGAVIVDLESVLNEGNRPNKYINDFTPYEFIAEDKGKLLVSGDGESMTLNSGIFEDGDTLLIIPEVSDIELIAGVGVNIYGNQGVPSNHILRLGEMAVLTHYTSSDFWWLNIIPQITSQTIPQIASFTAKIDLRYTTNGTITVTDPTPVTNKGYIVHVIGGTSTIGGVGYTTGDLVYRYYDGSSWISTNMNANTGVGATQNARATRLELTGNISLPISVGGSVTVIDFDNTVFNVDPTVFTNNGAGTITCTLAGNYLVTTSIVLESPLASAITKSELGIRKNGTNIICATTDDTPIALGNNIRSLTTSTIINLSANDTLQAVVNLFGASATGQGLRLPALFGTTATQVSNISIERLEVSEFDVDATPTDGSSNAVSSNGVFDALALRKKVIVSDTVSASVTGVIVETLVKTYEVPVGSLSTSGFLDLFAYSSRAVTAGVHTMTIKINSTNNFATASTIATLNTNGNFAPFLLMKGEFVLKDNLIIGNVFNSSTGTNYANSGSQYSIACNNTSNSVWFFVSITPTAAGQIVTLQGVEILN